MKDFWKNLKKPIFVLAPMADVTDCAFRALIAKYGKPDVMWSEFVSADGLCRATEEGKKKLLKDLEYSEAERPIVAQLFGSRPEYMEEASRLVESLGFDGIDINMGCPDKNIEKQGAGAAMIKNPGLAKEIIRAAKRGAPNLPISVKTRVGFNKVEIEEWLPAILEEDIAVLTVHARTRKEMSKVPARWEHVKRAVEIRDALGKDTLILGNGDALDMEDARAKERASGADGVMLGRAIFGNPWLFSENKEISVKEKLEVLKEHTNLFEEKLGGIKNFAIMKKHFKAYVKDFDKAGELREKLMQTTNVKEVSEIIDEFLKNK